MKNILACVALLLFLSSCNKDEEQCIVTPDASNIQINLTFESYEDSLAGITSKKELVDFFSRQPLIRDYIFMRTAYPNDSVFLNTIYQKVTNPAFDTLLMDTRSVFGNLVELQSQFSEAFRNVKYHYPDFVPPKVQTVISGLDNDMFVCDSLIIVSLDSYLGPGAKYRPNTYQYLLRQYVKENIVPSCMLIYGISDRFNKTDLEDKTVLADMIAYGKAYYFAKHMTPCVPDSVLTWYTPEELSGSKKNEDLIWARLIQDKVLYSTSHMIKQRYLSQRPKTLEVGEKCPGRIGQWVGWQIVNSYMENHPDVSLPALMSTPNAQAIFKESKYRPAQR